MSYLQNLTSRLASGISHLPEETRARHTSYLLARQNEDGGFSGREGASDLYYTGFTLRSLAILNALTPEVADQAAGFLRQHLDQSAAIVDFYSLLYSALVVQTAGGPDIMANSPADWPDRVAGVLETFRTKDGGYGKASDSASGSTYHTFLVGMCYELLGRTVPEPERILEFIASRQREDGGFVELKPMRRSGTNPTAAAIGVMQLIQGDQFEPDEWSDVGEFIAELVSFEGGLCANTRIPVADLLSTFTGSWTLAQLDALDLIETKDAQAYAQSLEQPAGGFRGGVWDECADVEYTFYGLALLGLLAE